MDERTGEFSIRLTDRADIRRAHEMQEGARREEVRRGKEVQAKYDGKRQRVVRRDGRVIEMRDDLIEQVKHRVVPSGRNGGAPSVRFGMAGIGERWERGPDGMSFYWDGGWEPRPEGKAWGSPQRDPAGNVWLKDPRWDGDDLTWALEDEVA